MHKKPANTATNDESVNVIHNNEENEQHIMKLQAQHSAKLNELNVGVVYLFGSYAEQSQHPLSDLDLGIVMRDPRILKGNSFSLHAALYDIFTDVFSGFDDKLDIVFLDHATLELQFDVIRHGKVLYECSQDFRLEYEDRVQMLYMDFYPLLQEMNRAVLEKI